MRLKAKESEHKHCPKGTTAVSVRVWASNSDIAVHAHTTTELLSKWRVERATMGVGGQHIPCGNALELEISV